MFIGEPKVPLNPVVSTETLPGTKTKPFGKISTIVTFVSNPSGNVISNLKVPTSPIVKLLPTVVGSEELSNTLSMVGEVIRRLVLFEVV